jgi:hypothetical protein
MKNSIQIALSFVILLTVCVCLVQGAMTTTISEQTAQLNGHQLVNRRLSHLFTKNEHYEATGFFVQSSGPGSGGGQGPRPDCY